MMNPQEKAEEIIALHKKQLIGCTRYDFCKHAITTVKCITDELRRIKVPNELIIYWNDVIEYIFNNMHCNAGK